MAVNSVRKHTEWMQAAFIIRMVGDKKERREYTIEAPRVWRTEIFRVDRRRFRKPRIYKSVSHHGADGVSKCDTDACQTVKQKA